MIVVRNIKKIFLCSLIFFSSINVGYAGIDFDGADDIVDTGYSTSDSQTSVAVWINIVSPGELTAGRIIDKSITSASADYIFGTSGTAGGVVCAATPCVFLQKNFTTAVGRWEDAGGAFSLNTWAHVAVTYNDSSVTNDPVFYVDGVSQSVTEDLTPIGTATTNAQNFGVGDRAGSDRAFDGKMSDFAYWDTILSATDVEILADSKVKRMPFQIKPANLQFYYPMDDFEDGATVSGASSVIDRTGNGNNGTPSNSPTARAEEVLTYN